MNGSYHPVVKCTHASVTVVNCVPGPGFRGSRVVTSNSKFTVFKANRGLAASVSSMPMINVGKYTHMKYIVPRVCQLLFTWFEYNSELTITNEQQ